MKKLETNQTPEQYISILLNDADKYMRSDAAERLGKIGNRTAIPYLRQALNDKHRYVRRSAVEALGDISSFSTLKDLMACLKDENDIVREEAVNSILKINEEESLLVLLGLPNDNATKMRIIEALIGFKNEALALSMMKKVLQMNEELAIFALTALKRTQRKFAVQAMAEALNSPRKNVVIEALQCLDKINIKIPAQTFAAVLNHGHPNVRETVADILTDYEDPAILSSLIQSTQDTSEAVRFKIAFSLARLEHPSAIPILKNALKSFDRETKYRAVNALERFKNKQSLPELAKLLADRGLKKYHPKIINIISAIDAKAIIPILEQVLQDTNPEQGKSDAQYYSKKLKQQEEKQAPKIPDTEIEYIQLSIEKKQKKLEHAQRLVHQTLEKRTKPLIKMLEMFLKQYPGAVNQRILLSDQKLKTTQKFTLAETTAILNNRKDFETLKKRKYISPENLYVLIFEKKICFSDYNQPDSVDLIKAQKDLFHNLNPVKYASLLLYDLKILRKKLDSFFAKQTDEPISALQSTLLPQENSSQFFSSVLSIQENICDPLLKQKNHLNTQLNSLSHVRQMYFRARRDYKKYTPQMKALCSQEDLFHSYCLCVYDTYLAYEHQGKPPNTTRDLKKLQLQLEAKINADAQTEPMDKAKHMVTDCISILDERISMSQLSDTTIQLLNSLSQQEQFAIKLKYGLVDGRPQTSAEVAMNLSNEYQTHFTNGKAQTLLSKAERRLSYLLREASRKKMKVTKR